MTDAPARSGVMTIADFVRAYDSEGPFEIIDGERIPMSPTVSGHSIVSRLIYDALRDYEREHHNGSVFFEVPYILPDTYSPEWVSDSRVPDISYFEAARLEKYKSKTPDWKNKPFMLVPDLAVEIVSPTDRYSAIGRKVELYREDGVALIWIIDPQQASIAIHTSDSSQQTNLSGEAVLRGGTVLPGFKIALAVVFAE